MNCINPIYKLVEYLNTQINSTTTDTQFRDLLTLTLNTTLNGYKISKRLNPTVCCPDCPTDECNGGTYYFGNVVNMISFYQNYVISENEKLGNRLCCSNFLGNYVSAQQSGISDLQKLYICCNKFSTEYITQFLLRMEDLYDADNALHVTMCADYPYITVVGNGVFEYSLFNEDSGLGDILAATELILNDSFKFIFLMYILNEGIVMTCSECAQDTNTINIMTTSNFIVNCLDPRT